MSIWDQPGIRSVLAQPGLHNEILPQQQQNKQTKTIIIIWNVKGDVGDRKMEKYITYQNIIPHNKSEY